MYRSSALRMPDQHSKLDIDNKGAECLNGVHVGVIGAGPFGLVAAANAKARGYCVTVLEKQGDVGGDWRQWGNPWSKLQVHRDTYLIRSPENIHVNGQEQLALYPSRDQMLTYYKNYAKQTGIYDDIIFNAKVTTRSKTEIFYEKEGKQKSVNVSHIYAVPGRVNSRRELKFDSEDKFQGKIGTGSGRDLVDTNMKGKNVVIVGHGSFAMENARHALEQQAASVTMLVRHEEHSLIYPRMVSFALSSHGAKKALERGLKVDEASSKMYALAGVNASHLKKIASPPFLTMPPTSDVYFLAIKAGKLKVVHAEVASLLEHDVVTKQGDIFPADVFIKTVGFLRDHKLDAELFLPGTGNISYQEHWWTSFADKDPALPARNRVFIGSGSNVEIDAYPNVWPPENGAKEFFQQLDGKPIERHPFGAQHPLDHLKDMKEEWNHYCKLFGVNISYPYTEADIKSIFGNFAQKCNAAPKDGAPALCYLAETSKGESEGSNKAIW